MANSRSFACRHLLDGLVGAKQQQPPEMPNEAARSDGSEFDHHARESFRAPPRCGVGCLRSADGSEEWREEGRRGKSAIGGGGTERNCVDVRRHAYTAHPLRLSSCLFVGRCPWARRARAAAAAQRIRSQHQRHPGSISISQRITGTPTPSVGARDVAAAAEPIGSSAWPFPSATSPRRPTAPGTPPSALHHTSDSDDRQPTSERDDQREQYPKAAPPAQTTRGHNSAAAIRLLG